VLQALKNNLGWIFNSLAHILLRKIGGKWRSYCVARKPPMPNQPTLVLVLGKLRPMIIRSSNVNTARIAPRGRDAVAGCLSVNLFTKARCNERRVLAGMGIGYQDLIV